MDLICEKKISMLEFMESSSSGNVMMELNFNGDSFILYFNYFLLVGILVIILK